jgi:hypothetical protein
MEHVEVLLELVVLLDSIVLEVFVYLIVLQVVLVNAEEQVMDVVELVMLLVLVLLIVEDTHVEVMVVVEVVELVSQTKHVLEEAV